MYFGFYGTTILRLGTIISLFHWNRFLYYGYNSINFLSFYCLFLTLYILCVNKSLCCYYLLSPPCYYILYSCFWVVLNAGCWMLNADYFVHWSGSLDVLFIKLLLLFRCKCRKHWEISCCLQMANHLWKSPCKCTWTKSSHLSWYPRTLSEVTWQPQTEATSEKWTRWSSVRTRRSPSIKLSHLSYVPNNTRINTHTAW